MIQAITGTNYMHPNKALLCLAFSAFLWSTSGLVIKLIDLNPMAIAGMRSAIAATVMLLLMRGRLQFTWSFPQVSGAIAYALTMILFVTATKMTTAANAILLQYTAPVFTAILGAWFLKEKVSRFDWVIIGLVIGGMFLFFFDRMSFSGIWGNVMAVGSGITLSYFILCMRLQKDASPLETVILGNLATMLFCFPFYFQQVPTIFDGIAIFYMGVLQIGLSFIIFSTAIKFVAALDAILVQTLDPLLNPIWVYIIIGETPGRWALVGGAIVLTAVTVRNIHSNRKMQKEAPT